MLQTLQQLEKSTGFNDNLNQLEDEKINLNILAVDDDAFMRICLEELLKTYGYCCTLAENGKKALSLLNQYKFDIILLDLMMPEMGGHQVMAQVKEKFPDLDVIIVSGDATFDNATKALRLGAKDFISKPYKPDELIKCIRHIQETRKLKSKLIDMHQQVLVSEQRYRFFINNSPDLIYLLDNKGKITFINDRVMAFLGYEAKELIGKNFSSLVYAEDLPQVNYCFSQNNQFPDVNQIMEFRLIPKSSPDGLLCFESETIVINTIMPGLINDKENVEQIFSGIYGTARDVTQKKKFEKQISFQLNHDALTSLPNRILFKDRINYALTQAQRNNSKFAVLYMDMDRFKTINDSMGHPAGDQLLRMMSKRIVDCLRESDTLARIGGDEFLLLMPELGAISDVEVLIKKMHLLLYEPFSVEKQDIFVSFSIGISVFPEDGKNADTLIKHADMAMYQSKRQKKGGYQFFSNNLITQFQPNLAIENDIRKALSEDQFEVYFQPQFNVKAHKISGVEALIRWNHPEKGLIMPDAFIPLAEESDLICDIGNWVLEASMKTFQQWNNNSALRDITLAINISALQFAQNNFCSIVLNCMRKYQINGSQIELEITENVVLQDIKQVISKFKFLSRYGVRFAIDDFGMGYSSLSYLQELPLNNLKIDRSFISSIQSSKDSSSIISAVVSMAKEMNMEIVAEGVETEVQLNYIRNIGCPIVQGYYFAKPMPTADAKNLALAQAS
jgi:diguanylate cyclase (GGDEF)-like protein/PAS domain S-box-containing protein